MKKTAKKETPGEKEPVKKKLTVAELSAVLRKKEYPIRNRSFEIAFALDEYGTELFRKKGTKTSVDVKEEEDLLRGCRVLTHNHPDGGSLSDSDIAEAIRVNLKEIRCFGTEYQYSLRPGKSGWIIAPEVAIAEWKEIEEMLSHKYQVMYDTISVGINDKNAQREVWMKHSHELLQLLAKRHNFIYTRNKW